MDPTREEMSEEFASDPGNPHNLPAVNPDVNNMIETMVGGPSLVALHNFKGTKEEIWRMTALATGPDVKTIDSLAGGAIVTKWFYAHRITIAGDEPGEMIDAVRCVLITPDKQAYAFVSDGIARDLAGIIQAFGLDPLDPPLELTPTRVKTRRGFYTYKLAAK